MKSGYDNNKNYTKNGLFLLFSLPLNEQSIPAESKGNPSIFIIKSTFYSKSKFRIPAEFVFLIILLPLNE